METAAVTASTSGRKILPFGNEYGIPVAMKAVRAAGLGDTLFICGQMDMDGNGVPRADHSLEEQTLVSLELAYKAAEEVGFQRGDIVKLGVHYVVGEVAHLPDYIAFVRSRLFDARTVVTFTALESFPSGDAARVEIDALAVNPAGRSARRCDIKNDSQVIRQNELVFASAHCGLMNSDTKDTSEAAFRSVAETLLRVESSANDACAVWLYVPLQLTSEDLSELIEALATYFPRPAPVITVVRLAGQSEVMLRLDVLAICGCEKDFGTCSEGTSKPQFSPALSAGRYAFVGGHFSAPSLSTEDQTMDHLVEDSHRAMRQLRDGLQSVGFAMADIIFVNAYFIGHQSMERWTANAQVRSRHYEAPGPAATGVEVSGLHPKSLQLTASCIAMREEQK